MPAQQPLDEVLQRVQGEYIEMPGLRLTTAQAQRLWGLDRAACDALLDALVDAKFLSGTTGRCIHAVRSGTSHSDLTSSTCQAGRCSSSSRAKGRPADTPCLRTPGRLASAARLWVTNGEQPIVLRSSFLPCVDPLGKPPKCNPAMRDRNLLGLCDFRERPSLGG